MQRGNTLIGIIIILVFIGGGTWWYTSQSTLKDTPDIPAPTETPAPEAPETTDTESPETTTPGAPEDPSSETPEAPVDPLPEPELPDETGFLPPEPACVAGGCTSIVCTEDTGKPILSTCEWTDSYACYPEHGICERQADNACGWTQSEELVSCIAEANGPQTEVDPEPEGDPVFHALVTYTADGFEPTPVTIANGETVRFVNQSGSNMRIGSDKHPTHREYPGSDITKCNSGEIIFDQCESVPDSNFWEFTFTEAGSWDYHNHVRASHGGTIVVE